MSYAEWEEKSVRFLTKLAKNPVIHPTWNKYDVSHRDRIQLLQNDVKIALFADENILDDNDTKLIQDVTKKCIDNSEHKVVTDVAVIHVCVRIESPLTSEHIVPIFRVRNCSKNPEACNVIDHLGNVYENFENYLINNTWYESTLIIPSQAQYKLGKNDKCYCLIHDQTSRVAKSENSNMVAEMSNVTTSVELSEEKVINSIRLMDQIQKNQIINHKHKLNPEHHEKFDALRRGYHETVQPGEIREHHGDKEFNRSMSSIDNIDEYFDNFSLRDGSFQINDELTIHPRAFVQLPEKDRQTILETTRKVKNGEITREVFLKQIQNIGKDYRFTLDTERSEYVKYLTRKFEVNTLQDVIVGGKQIFADLKPSDIDRLHQVTKYSLCGDENYVRLGIDFSTKAGAKNLTDFNAASEYVVRTVQAEIKARRRTNPDPENRGNAGPKDFYRDKIIDELRADDFRNVVESFETLRNRIDIANKDIDPSFKNSFAAANHYDKHKILSKVDDENDLSPETYFNIAQDMTSAPYSEVTWTQDGSSLYCTFISEAYNALAIKIVNLTEKTEVIATLFENAKNRRIVGSRYYYHPDY